MDLESLKAKAQNVVNRNVNNSVKTVYQQNLAREAQLKQFDLNTRSVLGQISKVAEFDPYRGNELMNQFKYFQQDKSSPFYDPYSQPTNKSVSNLQSYGFDTNNLNDDWFSANNGWISSNLLYNGTTNTPSKPGKNATWDQNVAYELYQYQKSEGTTKKAEQEWKALQEEIAYMANDPYHNYSDQAIIDSIDWSKYKTLDQMNDENNKYYSPVELNRAIGYSKDAINGAIWAARNGGGTGDIYQDMANSYNGVGNVWQEDPEVAAKLTWGSDDFNPYSVGMTLKQAGTYFGVYGFGQDEINLLKQGRDPKTGAKLDPNDRTAMTMRNEVLNGEERTLKAEKELEELNKKKNDLLGKGYYEEEDVRKKLENYMLENCPTLLSMDESLTGDPEKILGTTRAINFSKKDLFQSVSDSFAERGDTNVIDEMESVVNVPGDYTKNIGNGKPDMSSGNVTLDNKAGNMIASGGVSDSPMGFSKFATQDKEIVKAKDNVLAKGVVAVEDDLNESESAQMNNAGSIAWNDMVQFCSGFMSNYESVKAKAAASVADTAKNYFETAMDDIKFIGTYKNVGDRFGANYARFETLKEKYGDVDNYRRDVEPERTIIVGDDVNVVLTFDTENNKYVVTNVSVPSRGLYYDEYIYPNANREGTEAYELMKMANQAAEEATEDAKEIQYAHHRWDNLRQYGPEDKKGEIDEYIGLEAKIKYDQDYLESHMDEFNEKNASFAKQNNSILRSAMVNQVFGNDASAITEAQHMVEYLSQFYDEPSLPMSDETYLQKYRRYFGEEEYAQALFNDKMETQDEIEELENAFAYLEANGYQVPDAVRQNMQYKLEDLKYKQQQLAYDTILTTTDQKKLGEVIAAGKAFEEKYGDMMEQWDAMFDGQYYTLGKSPAHQYDMEGSYITDDDKDIYYYLLGRKVLELGDKFDDTWENDSGNYADSEALLSEIMKDGNDFIQHMSNDDYGVWTTREADRVSAKAEEMVNSGFVGGAIANVASTVATPIESVSSAVYLLDRLLEKKRINPDSRYRTVSQFKESTRAATFQSIKDTFGEGTWQEKLASFGYEIYANRGDSMMNAMVFGALLPKFGIDLVDEIVGAIPMGTSAALNAAAEAIENGASMDQAWLIAGITFVMETASEGITYGNIQEAMKTGEQLTTDTLKGFAKEWLTRSGVDEMLGESVTDIVEKAASSWAAMLDPDGEYYSEHQRLVEKYAAKYGPEEAEWRALQEEAKDVLHTALVSYISAGSEVLTSAGKAAFNSLNYYRAATKDLQHRGVNISTLGLMVSDWQANREAKKAAKNTSEVNASAKDEGIHITVDDVDISTLETSGEVAEEQEKEYAIDLEVLESASRSKNAATRSASIASVLGFANTDQNKDRANAAAVKIEDVFENGIEDVQEILEGGMITSTNANTIKLGIMYAMIGGQQSACSTLVTSDEFKMASPDQKAIMLCGAVLQDVQNAAVKQNVDAAVRDNRVAEQEKMLIANGALEGTRKAEQKVDEAKAANRQAQKDLETKQAETEAAAQANQSAAENFAKNPTDENGKELDRTTTELSQRDESAQQYEQHKEKAQAEQEKAEEELRDTKQNELTNARQQAEANVDQEDQQRAEIAAQQEAQARELEAEQARQQAEEDERTGKAQEEREDASIEMALDAETRNNDLTEEQRDKRREQLKNQRDKIKFSKVKLGESVNNTEGLLALSAFSRKLGVPIEFADMDFNIRGKYQDGVIYLNKNRIVNGSMSVGQALVEAALHEIPHAMENLKAYQGYRNVVLTSMFGAKNGTDALELYNTNDKYRAAIDDIIAQRAKANDKLGGKDLNVEHDHDIKVQNADKEIVADFARLNLNQKDVIERFMDAGLGGQMRNTLHNINQSLKNFFRGQNGAEYQQYKQNIMEYNARESVGANEKITNMLSEEDFYKQYEYLRRAERAYQKAMNELAKTSVHPEGGQFSVAQIAQSTGMTFDADTLTLYDKNGNEVDGINNMITPDMIKDTPVGLLIDHGLTGEQNQKAKDMMAGLMNMVARYKDSNLVWEIGATTLSSTFSALKSNSDPQYKTTVDFGTVCAKTQAIIDVLSQVMLDRVAEGKTGGLTREEIMKVYNEVNKAGLSVPCPVCYVFSRWMGVPSLLGQMSQYQNDYVVKNEDGSINKKETQKVADKYIKDAETKYGDAKAINNAKTKMQNNLAKLETRRMDLEKKQYDKTLSEDEKANVRKQIDDVLKQMTDLDKQIGEVSAYNWITQALCKKEKNGKYVVDDKFQLTPDEILFDLNRTGDFAKYEKNWKYRNTRGAGMGKAIMPYSGETIGDILYGVKNNGRQNPQKNPWLKMDDKAATRQLKYAQDRAKKQNLVGGQRIQSTSDFRPEWGLDYIMSFLELQAAGSKVQMYTKVAEAVDFFASVGADVNLSIMGQGTGWHEATQDELSALSDDEKSVRAVELNGKTYLMDFSPITGMEYYSGDETRKTATALKNLYNNVQMILVGMNDTHIRLAMKNSNIDFIIPWHSSGNSKDVLAGLIAAVGEKLDSSVDYTTTQTDMVKGTSKKYTDENGNKVEYTAPGEQTADQKKLWDARMKLLTKGGNALTLDERNTLMSNDFTRDLYIRFTTPEGKEGYDPDCYNVKLSKDQAVQIFPYEYWDTSLTKDQADENGRRFAAYCDSMGIVPRFSQFKDDPGYWKLLIDRPMYNNDGTYHQQSIIDVTNAQIGALNEEGQLTDSDLPTQAQAKYAPKDPRNPNYEKYTEAEKNAVDAAKAALDVPYNDGEGQNSVFGDETEADRQLMEDVNNDYAIAVSRGDMEAAQEDVDFYAEQSGYTEKVYHGTNSYGFTSFDMSKGKGVIFASYSKELAGTYATDEQSGVYDLYARPGNQLVVDAENRDWDDIPIRELAKDAEAKGYNDVPEWWFDSPIGSMSTREIADYAKKHGYDSVRINNVVDNGSEGNVSGLTDIGIFFNQDDVKSADPVTYDDNGNVIPLDQRFTDSPDIRYSTEGKSTEADMDLAAQNELNQTLIDAGVVTQEDVDIYNGNLPGRPAIDNGKAQRQFGRYTAQESDALHDDVKEYLYTHSGYTPDTNQAQIDRAIDWVKSHASDADPEGFFGALQEAQRGDFDAISADGQARMLTLMGMAALKGEQTGDHSSELMLADLYNKQGTEAGRALQARKMFRLMTPVGRMATLERMTDQINEQYAKKGIERRVELSKLTLEAAAVAESEEDFDKVRHAAAQELASQMPASWKEKLQAWRMLAMLGNTRTHVRNFLGNAIFMPAVGLKNKIGAALEYAFLKEGDERTKTFGLASKEARDFAKKDAKKREKILRGESKYSEGSAVQQERKMFGQGKGIVSKTLGRGVQALSDANSKALELEDWVFLKRHYRNALAGYMTANNLTEADMKGDTLDKAVAYAVNEAQKATYRDANEIATWLNNLKNPAGRFLVNAVLPFKKTPANILKRGIEYSPVGIIRSLTTDMRHLNEYRAYQEGKLSVLPDKALSPNQFIDRLASGLSGTIIAGIGAALSALGVVKVGLDDDDDEFDKQNGSQEYSIELFGHSYTIDWAAPVCMPFFVGATIMEEIQDAADDKNKGFDIGKVLDSILNIAEPVFNLSMLDGLNQTLTTNSYGEENNLTQIGEKIVANYFTSFVPSFSGALARSIDTTRRKNFVESGADLSVFRNALEQVENKIPYLSKTNIPYRDVWGNADVSSPGWAVIENFISPGYGNELKNDPVTNELKRIYKETGDKNMIPKTASKTISINGKSTPLTAEQYDQYIVDRGQLAYNSIESLMNSPVWQYCDDETRAMMIADAWTYANQIARHNLDSRCKLDSWVANAQYNGSFVDTTVNRAADANRKDYIDGYGQTMAEALDAGDTEMYELSLAALENADAKESEIRASLRDYFKPKYQEAFENGDEDTMEEIEWKLDSADVGFKEKDYKSWVPSEDEEEDEETEIHIRRWLNMEQ